MFSIYNLVLIYIYTYILKWLNLYQQIYLSSFLVLVLVGWWWLGVVGRKGQAEQALRQNWTSLRLQKRLGRSVVFVIVVEDDGKVGGSPFYSAVSTEVPIVIVVPLLYLIFLPLLFFMSVWVVRVGIYAVSNYPVLPVVSDGHFHLVVPL